MKHDVIRQPDDAADSRPSLAPEVQAYCDAALEDQRLGAGPGQLEWVRTQELLMRFLPSPPAVILDVGGGPGVYA